MSALKRLSSKLVYIHGTNGSGKSTLARALLAAAAHPTGIEHLPGNPKASWTNTAGGVVFIGKYGNACGGVDGLSPYAAIKDIVGMHADEGEIMLAEGLVTPGLATCQELANMVNTHLFIHLDVPLEACVANVLTRRSRKGTDKPYDTANLIKKRASAESWIRRLGEAGLAVQICSWNEAYLRCLEFLELQDFDHTNLL